MKLLNTEVLFPGTLGLGDPYRYFRRLYGNPIKSGGWTGFDVVVW